MISCARRREQRRTCVPTCRMVSEGPHGAATDPPGGALRGVGNTPLAPVARAVPEAAPRAGVAAHPAAGDRPPRHGRRDRKSTRLNSSHVKISYAVFCLKKKCRSVAALGMTSGEVLRSGMTMGGSGAGGLRDVDSLRSRR